MGEGVGRESSVEELYRLRKLSVMVLAALLVVTLVLPVSMVSILAYQVNAVAHEVDDMAVTCCPSLALTPSGGLMIAYGTASGLVLATETSDHWSTTQVIESVGSGFAVTVDSVSIATDSDGNPHIVSVSRWSDESATVTKVIHSTNTVSGWRNTVVDEDCQTYGASIAVDSNSNVHIVYAKNHWSQTLYYPASVNLTYASDSTGEWVVHDLSNELPDYWWGAQVFPSICVDGMGQAHVAALMDYVIWYLTDLTGDVQVERLGYGNPGNPDVEPSLPSITVDSDGVVHVLYFNEVQMYPDDPCERSVDHFVVSEDDSHYQNMTLDSTLDLTHSPTCALFGADGELRLFYYDVYTVGFVTVTGESTVAEIEELFASSREETGSWESNSGDFAVSRDDGIMVISKPYGVAGYLTDSVTFGERLSIALSASLILIIVAAIIASILLPSLIISLRKLHEDDRWRKVIK